VDIKNTSEYDTRSPPSKRALSKKKCTILKNPRCHPIPARCHPKKLLPKQNVAFGLDDIWRNWRTCGAQARNRGTHGTCRSRVAYIDSTRVSSCRRPCFSIISMRSWRAGAMGGWVDGRARARVMQCQICVVGCMCVRAVCCVVRGVVCMHV
jgi:hypothetical protein